MDQPSQDTTIANRQTLSLVADSLSSPYPKTGKYQYRKGLICKRCRNSVVIMIYCSTKKMPNTASMPMCDAFKAHILQCDVV